MTCPTCGTENETDECEICKAIEKARQARNKKACEYAQIKAAERREANLPYADE